MKRVQIVRRFFCIQTENGDLRCVKILRIRSYSGPHFPALGLNTKRYSISLRIQSACGKMRIRITPNTDPFYAVLLRKSPCSVQKWENTDQKKLRIWTFFTQRDGLFLRNLECYNKNQLSTCLIRIIRQTVTRCVLRK